MALAVFAVDYETDDATFKAKILAESREDVLGYLKTQVGDKAEGYRIVNLEQRDDIHAITTKVLEAIRGPEVTQEEKVVEVPRCPWCQRTDFESDHAFKMHISKAHTNKKK